MPPKRPSVVAASSKGGWFDRLVGGAFVAFLVACYLAIWFSAVVMLASGLYMSSGSADGMTRIAYVASGIMLSAVGIAIAVNLAPTVRDWRSGWIAQKSA